jgi:hypothetical protein
VYGRVSRGRLNSVLKLYDFPDASQTSPGRDLTTTPLQQLFVMNGSFIRNQAVALADSLKNLPGEADRLRALYRKILARDPTPKELDFALTYIAQSPIAEFAEVLLSTNEEIFWP